MEFEVVSPPDEAVRQAAVARHEQLTKPRGALGRLETLGTWLAACQGECPPHAFRRARIVVFAGDHGVATRGVSAYPPEVTAQMVANFQHGGAAINVLAGIAGATVRVVDMAVATDTTVDEHKVRKSSGAINVEDALTEDEVQAALAAGKAIADEEVDAGADLLVAGDMGIGNTTPAAVLVAALTGTEPVAVVGRGTGIDDQTWMRKTAAIRDALRRAKPVTADPVALLRTTAGADITAMAAFLAQAAVRKTPVVLDGVVSGAAALLAEELAPGARAWWVAGHRSTEPAHTLVLEQLDLTPLLEMNMRLGEGSGAAAALPLLSMAVQVLAEMATFADAGVSTESTSTTPSEPNTNDPQTTEAPTNGTNSPEASVDNPATTDDEPGTPPETNTAPESTQPEVAEAATDSNGESPNAAAVPNADASPAESPGAAPGPAPNPAAATEPASTKPAINSASTPPTAAAGPGAPAEAPETAGPKAATSAPPTNAPGSDTPADPAEAPEPADPKTSTGAPTEPPANAAGPGARAEAPETAVPNADASPAESPAATPAPATNPAEASEPASTKPVTDSTSAPPAAAAGSNAPAHPAEAPESSVPKAGAPAEPPAAAPGSDAKAKADAERAAEAAELAQPVVRSSEIEVNPTPPAPER